MTSRSKYWKDKADHAWGEWMHRTYTECAVNNSDCSGPLEAHHLIRKGVYVTRHCKENGIMLCAFHHRLSTDCSPHKGLPGFEKWLEANKPDVYEWVVAHKWAGGKPDYQAAYKELTI